MSKLYTIWNVIVRYRWIVAILTFIVVVGFVDENSYYIQHLQNEEIQRLQTEKEKLHAQYLKDTRISETLDKDPKAMVRIARERFYMKKPNEDIYIFEKK